MTWRGSAFLGNGWAAFRGASAGNSAHAHPSLQVTLSNNDSLIITGKSFSVTGQAVIVAPNVVHLLRPTDEVTLLLIEPQTRLARYFTNGLNNNTISLLDTRVATQIKLDGPLQNCLDDVIDKVPKVPVSVDNRLEQALMLLRSDIPRNTIADIARQVGLSPARLRVIAKRDLGVSLSDWMIWRKLERAGRLLTQGADIAGAAYGAGFADQSHFARAMRSHFGITAKMIANLMTRNNRIVQDWPQFLG